MATTRRGFLRRALGAGAGLTLATIDSGRTMAQTPASQLERNKAVALRFKKAQAITDG